VSKPFRGVINIDIKQSTPDWEPYTRPMAPEGAPNVLVPDDRAQPHHQRAPVTPG